MYICNGRGDIFPTYEQIFYHFTNKIIISRYYYLKCSQMLSAHPSVTVGKLNFYTAIVYVTGPKGALVEVQKVSHWLTYTWVHSHCLTSNMAVNASSQ